MSWFQNFYSKFLPIMGLDSYDSDKWIGLLMFRPVGEFTGRCADIIIILNTDLKIQTLVV